MDMDTVCQMRSLSAPSLVSDHVGTHGRACFDEGDTSSGIGVYGLRSHYFNESASPCLNSSPRFADKAWSSSFTSLRARMHHRDGSRSQDTMANADVNGCGLS